MKNLEISDLVVLVTGAGGQIGQALIEKLLFNNARVIAIDNDQDKLNQLENNFKNKLQNIMIDKIDVHKENEVKLIFKKGNEKFGIINALVNNAGVAVFNSWKERSEHDFNFVVDVNLKGPFLFMREFLLNLNKINKKGVIVNVASHYGIISPNPTIYGANDRRSSEVYGATKAGLIQMSKYFSINGLLDGIDVRVNSIAPGGIINEKNPQSKSFIEKYSKLNPMSRMAKVNEVVDPIIFLLSPMSSYINGHTLVVDGGMTSW